jgi:hypothetical protein
LTIRPQPIVPISAARVPSPTADAARTEDRGEGVQLFISSPLFPPFAPVSPLSFHIHETPDFLRDFEIFYFRFNSRSATENQTETELRKTEKKLRFSVQTETFCHLPTTYVKKYENKKFVQPAGDTTIVASTLSECPHSPGKWQVGPISTSVYFTALHKSFSLNAFHNISDKVKFCFNLFSSALSSSNLRSLELPNPGVTYYVHSYLFT